MTNNFDENEPHDEFNEHEVGLHDDQPRSGMTGNLREAWRTRPLFKFMVLLIAVFAVGVAAFSFLGGGSTNTDMAHLSKPPDIKGAPGGAATPYYRQQTELASAERADEAAKTNGSAIPTPLGQTTDVGNFGNTQGKDEQLNELRAETENLKRQVQQQQVQQVQQQQQQKPPEQFDNSLAEAMQGQMKQLLEGWAPKGIKNVTVIKPEDLKQEAKTAENASAASGASTLAKPPKPIVNAGTVSYGQLLTEANSDVPGPILAQIVSGPLAGARAVGSFEVATGYEKYLVLKFSIADKKGKDYQISAVALDPDTTLGGMATEVDERYFVRVVLPAAAGFLQGLGSGLSQGNSSITSNGDTSISTYGSNGFHQGVYQGLAQGAQTMGQFFQEQANLTRPLVRVASGTPIGIFFVAPVYDPDSQYEQQLLANQQAQAAAAANGQIPGTGLPGQGYGVPGQGYGVPAGYGAQTGYGATPAGYTGVTGYGSQAATAASGVPYPNYAQPTTNYARPSISYGGYGNSGVGYGYGQ